MFTVPTLLEDKNSHAAQLLGAASHPIEVIGYIECSYIECTCPIDIS
jgi:hypothetical protein